MIYCCVLLFWHFSVDRELYKYNINLNYITGYFQDVDVVQEGDKAPKPQLQHPKLIVVTTNKYSSLQSPHFSKINYGDYKTQDTETILNPFW